MGLDRRTFLQGTGLAFLTMGMGAMGGDRLTPSGIASHFQALAQSKKRKFALLVGIDRYGKETLLQGCKTDVELQRELLIYRLGFDPRDILVLMDDRATPEQIETAFSKDFLLQAKAEDIVVFHFSGLGSKISLPDTSIPSTSDIGETGNPHTILANCLLCGGESIGKAGILEETLFARGRSLPTQNVTMVFDTSYAGNENSLQGNARSRFLPTVDFSISAGESLPLVSQPSSPPGVLLEAARAGETAIEVVWDGFSAGLFTYTLVQALWQTTAPNTLQATFSRSAAQMQGIGNQRPQKLGRKAGDASITAYFTQPKSLSSAEGAIAEVDDNGKSVSLHLAGLPITALQNYAANSQLMAGDPESAIALKVVSRSGLTVKAERIDSEETREQSLSPGCLVRESLRYLPRNIGLIVALDAKFSRIERVDATSAFANIATVSSVVTAGEQSADCLFSRASNPLAIASSPDKQSLPQGYGLFSTGFVALPNTLGLGDEAIKAAVERLIPKFNVLLAVKLWQAIVNEASSQLAVKVGLQAINPQHPQTIERATRGFETQKPKTNHFEKAFPAFPSGESIRFEIENAGDRPIYLTMVGVKATGVPLVLSDQSHDTGIEIAPNSILSIPKAVSTLNGFTPTTSGIEEIIVICSRSPFENLARVLATLSSSRGQGEGLIEASQPLDIARSLLQDINDASDLSASDSEYALDVKAWAALRFVYEVI